MSVAIHFSIFIFSLFIKLGSATEEMQFGNVTLKHRKFTKLAEKCAEEDCKELAAMAKKYQEGEEDRDNLLQFGQTLEKCVGICVIRKAYEERNLTQPDATEEDKRALYEKVTNSTNDVQLDKVYEEKQGKITACQLGTCKEVSERMYTCLLAPTKGCPDSINTSLDYTKCINDCVASLEGKKKSATDEQTDKTSRPAEEEKANEGQLMISKFSYSLTDTFN